ncbi:hypothetical protein MIDIC_330039 [Alphaproteobacteria bacterium]
MCYLHADSYPDYGSDRKVIEHYVEVFCKEEAPGEAPYHKIT